MGIKKIPTVFATACRRIGVLTLRRLAHAARALYIDD
jgi:hypothetical protein